MSFTNYLEHATLDYLFGATSYTPSGTLYVALSTTTPAEDGTSFTEPSSASGYSRVAVTNNKTNWSNAAQVSTSGSIHNNTAITFGQASGNWGTITHAGLYDASISGNLLTQSALQTSKTVASGETLSFPSGGFIIRMD